MTGSGILWPNFAPLLLGNPQVHEVFPMLSAPPSPTSDFRLPLPSLLIRLATPPRQQVNFHAPLVRPGTRLGGWGGVREPGRGRGLERW